MILRPHSSLSRSSLLRFAGRRHSDSNEISFDQLGPEDKRILSEAVQRFAGESPVGSTSSNWKPTWVLVKPRSIVIVAELGGRFAKIFVKRKRVLPGNSEELASKAITAESAFARLVGGELPPMRGCSVVSVLATYPDLLVQVYEYVEGDSLQEAILAAAVIAGAKADRTLELIGLAAHWLSTYQDSLGTLDTELESSAFTRSYKHQCALFQQRYQKLATKLNLDELIEWGRREYESLSAEDRIAMRCHGDFGPFNMLVDKQGYLVVIDFEGDCVGSRMLDAYYFLYQLWKLRFNPLLQRSFITEAKDVFVKGYGAERLNSVHLVRLEAARRYMGTLAYLGGERLPRRTISSFHDAWLATACVARLGKLLKSKAPRRHDAVLFWEK